MNASRFLWGDLTTGTVADEAGNVIGASVSGSGQGTYLGLWTTVGRINFIPDSQIPYIVHPTGEATYTAADGDSGLGMARQLRPLVILCDMYMPCGNGFRVCSAIREEQSLRHSFLIAMSGNMFDDTRKSAMEAGADEFMLKPLQPRPLLETLERIFTLRGGSTSDGAVHTTAAPQAPEPQPARPAAPVAQNFVRFWGVRGTLPVPGTRSLRYGGNTSCVTLELPGSLLIFDAGTGIKALGDELMGEAAAHVLGGAGVDGAVRCFIFRWLRAAGFKKVYSYVRGDNPVGLRAARCRQQPIGKLRYLRLRALRPWVFGAYGSDFPLLVRNGPAGEEARREKASRAWFESWLGKPLSKRSTGYHGMPEDYFASTADFISEALRLDPHADSVLDVGCDSAMVTRLVARRCRRLVGVDFIPGLLAEVPHDIADRQSPKRISLVAADGRLLPFRSDLFTKVYCCAVVHTLASREHGLRMVHELIRVCQPGGEVLVASIPDTGKRLYALLEKWRQADTLLDTLRLLLSLLLDTLRLLLSLALPRPLKSLVRSILGLERADGPSFLDYDVGALKRQFEAEGLECQIVQFPDSYWKRDFRRTRSNLLLRKRSRPQKQISRMASST